MERRKFLLALGAAALGFAVTPAMAKDGEGGNSGPGGGGNSGPGGGGGNSGPGGGENDNDDDEDDDDDREEDRQKDHERALKAVRKGKIVPLQRLMAHMRENYKGRILNVDLTRIKGQYFYKVKLLGQGNHVRTHLFDARNLTQVIY